MANGKKRSAAAMQGAPTTTGTSSSSSAVKSSKKRKMDGQKKLYAVRVGRNPGVYSDYADCQAQTVGFPHAEFKSFYSKGDAEAFVAGKAVQPGADEPPRFYAVAVGQRTGIFTDWATAKAAKEGVKGPKYKRFATRAECVEFIKEFGSVEAIKALGLKPDEAKQAAKDAKVPKNVFVEEKEEDDGALKIYTDGSSRGNGQLGATAGFGVFFGTGDPRNVAEPLLGEPQTNQRAELMAMQRALEIVPEDQDVLIVSDSQYSINCVTKWPKNWEKNNWQTSTGDDVKNKDIIKAVIDLMETRRKKGGATKFKWVKGHARDPGNEAADFLAVKGASMARLAGEAK